MERIRAWLGHPDSSPRMSRLLNDRAPRTNLWFLESETFADLKEGRKRALLLHGQGMTSTRSTRLNLMSSPAGCGKSTMMCVLSTLGCPLAADSLYQRRRSPRSAGILLVSWTQLSGPYPFFRRNRQLASQGSTFASFVISLSTRPQQPALHGRSRWNSCKVSRNWLLYQRGYDCVSENPSRK